MPSAGGPLQGLTVIDAAQVWSGPFLAALLGDFGAEVIKVERPGEGDPIRVMGLQKDGVSLGWKYVNRNKKSITLNLAHPKGQELLRRIVAFSDVLVEGFRPGTMEGWGLGYDALSKIRPELVMVRVSGFGQFGPYKDRPGFGTLAEAMSGFAAVTGSPDGPPTLPALALGDCIAATYGAFAALVALRHREVKGGTGQSIDVSLLEPLFAFLGSNVLAYDQLGVVPKRKGNRGGASAPRNLYLTKDGKWVAIAGATQNIAKRVFEAIGQPHLIEDPRFSTNQARVAHADAVDKIVTQWTTGRDRNEVMEVFLRHEVAAAPVLNVDELIDDPHLAARGTIVRVDDEELGPIRMPNVQPMLSKTPGEVQHAGPPLGKHNWEIYHARLGLNKKEIDALTLEGVI